MSGLRGSSTEAGPLARDVVALFVDPRGPYPSLIAEWYDEARDARTYTGDLPVVAHPPCGPWGRLRHLSRKDDPSHAPYAVELVRRVGGVLEHPCGSLLWRELRLPLPGELPDAFGGRTIEVCQCDWGHPARKRTWLYIVGISKPLPPIPPPSGADALDLGRTRTRGEEAEHDARAAGDQGV